MTRSDFINYAVDGATRMQTLISDLLNYSRVGTQGKSLVPTDAEALFQRVLQTLQTRGGREWRGHCA